MDRQVPRVAQIRKADQVRVTKLDEGGKTRGFQIEYRDGRVEAAVRPETVRRRLSVSQDG